eukprot:336031_1
MAALNPDNNVDSDNDTQMSEQDNAIPIESDTTNTNKMDDTTNSNNKMCDDAASNIDNAVNNDDDNKMNDDNNDPNTAPPPPPQYKYTWQWPENDGTWHDYDATTQLLLDQLSIGQKLTIKAGKWTYDVTKTSTDACTQLNTQTQNTRVCRRKATMISTNTNIVQNGNHDWIGNGRYVFMWQFLENTNKWV